MHDPLPPSNLYLPTRELFFLACQVSQCFGVIAAVCQKGGKAFQIQAFQTKAFGTLTSTVRVWRSVFAVTSDGAIGAKVAALMALPSYVNTLANDTWTTTGFGPAMTPLQAVRSDGDASLTILSRCPPLVSAGLLVSANLESNTGKHACADATQQYPR